MAKLLRVLIALVGLLLPVLVLLAVVAATYGIWQWRAEHHRLREMLEAEGVDWPHLGHHAWVMTFGQLLPIAAALEFVVAWIVILLQIRTA